MNDTHMDWAMLRAEAQIVHEMLSNGPTKDAAADARLIERAIELQALGFAMAMLFKMTADAPRH